MSLTTNDPVAYSPWRDAAERHPGIHIERCQLVHCDAAWVPADGVILLDDRLDRAGRNAALAHEIAHVDLGHEHVMTGGWHDWKHEAAADKLACCRLVTVAALAEGARRCDSPEELSEFLEVPLPLIRLRVKLLSAAEWTVIDAAVDDATENVA